MSIELVDVMRVEDTTGRVYYLGTLKPGEIKQLTFVPVVTLAPNPGDSNLNLNENAENGYQRAGETGRMDKIAEFVAERPNCIIPPVLLSCRGKWIFTPSKSNSAFGRVE